MHRYSAKLIVAAMASGALSAVAIAQTPPADTPPPATMPPTEPSAPASAMPPATQTAPAAASQTVNIGDQEIRSFALAVVEVAKIQRQYQPRLQAAAAEQRPALEQEANAKMTAAVEAQGLDPQTFNAISATARENPELEAKIREEVAKVQPQTPAGR